MIKHIWHQVLGYLKLRGSVELFRFQELKIDL